MTPCVNLLVWIVGFVVLDYALHKLNLVRHENFHLWKTYVEDICGTLICFGKNSTVSDILSALVLGMYALWRLYCSIVFPMYQPPSQCGSHDAISFGLLLVTILVPGGANGVRL